ncbi:MAG: HXXEE domain-containing protein [Caldibacillus debilis]|uniref:HXXEE domain-containing protein n=1 Tax=Caldibacillus debilis TaxID=301148 RepID=UPI000E3A200C|nr:HXXEE domain-containing protein [Caldibacillus debilis]MBY6272570.1 HXXEE domain-containing protein [Bacillaceae bacterium]REJ15693.1 MAG: HXXEE domain-containing protein [Caldibacillus debilis]
MFFEWLNDKLPLPAVLLLFPVVFMVHDFEEILTVEKWTKQNKEKVFALLPKKLHRFFWSSFHINTLEFAKDVFWIFLAITAAALIAVLFQWYGFFLIFLAIFFFHVFTHFGQSVLFKGYAPGVWTSLFLVLPYSLYAYYRLLHERAVQWEDLFWSFIGMTAAACALILFLIRGRDRAAKRMGDGRSPQPVRVDK